MANALKQVAVFINTIHGRSGLFFTKYLLAELKFNRQLSNKSI